MLEVIFNSVFKIKMSNLNSVKSIFKVKINEGVTFYSCNYISRTFGKKIKRNTINKKGCCLQIVKAAVITSKISKLAFLKKGKRLMCVCVCVFLIFKILFKKVIKKEFMWKMRKL